MLHYHLVLLAEFAVEVLGQTLDLFELFQGVEPRMQLPETH